MDLIITEIQNSNSKLIKLIDYEHEPSENFEIDDVDILESDVVEEESYERDYSNNQNFIPFKQQPPQQQQQKSITYDDILSSLNMKVVNGKLHMIQPQQQYRQQIQQQQMQQQYQQQQYRQQLLQQQYSQNIHQIPVIEEQQPISPLEYRRRVFLNLLQKRTDLKRLNQIKSKKLLFPQSNINISQQPFRNNNIGFRFVGK